MQTGRQRPAGWPADKLVAMAVMRTTGRGDWVAVSVATVVESDTGGTDGAAVGGASCHPRYFIMAKNRNREMTWCENDEQTTTVFKENTT